MVSAVLFQHVMKVFNIIFVFYPPIFYKNKYLLQMIRKRINIQYSSPIYTVLVKSFKHYYL